jgi:ATP-dependent DNA ligase
VGTGFDERSLTEILALLKKLKTVQRPISNKPADDAQTVWVEPRLIGEVQFA